MRDILEGDVKDMKDRLHRADDINRELSEKASSHEIQIQEHLEKERMASLVHMDNDSLKKKVVELEGTNQDQRKKLVGQESKIQQLVYDNTRLADSSKKLEAGLVELNNANIQLTNKLNDGKINEATAK